MKPINTIMADKNGILQAICQYSLTLQLLNQKLAVLLPDTLRSHCHLANIDRQTMTIDVNNAIWATRLRFFVPDILISWQQDKTLPPVKKIVIHINLSLLQKSATVSHHTKPAPISKHSGKLLHQLADQVNHEKLQAVLHRLAEHSRESN